MRGHFLRIFVYECLTGGGLLGDDAAPPASLLCEGRAMLTALAADLAATSGTHVVTMSDARLERVALPSDCRVHVVRSAAEEAVTFDRCAADADWTVVIAPESDGVLLNRCRRVIAAGGRLLGPSPRIVELTADKQQTAEHLARRDVPAPRGRLLAAGDRLPEEFAYPAVLKPVAGAGSQGLRLVASAQANVRADPLDADGLDADRLDAGRDRGRPLRLEPYHRGQAASVAVLCGPQRCLALPACRQRLSNDGRFAYLGGSLPLPPAWALRAKTLALRAVSTLVDPLGYLGVDLVLGDDNATDDVVIEINPRLTTSYVGLRSAAIGNLAAAMLAIARGEPCDLKFRREPVEFDADGAVRRAATSSGGSPSDA
jgi:hypothetical protein